MVDSELLSKYINKCDLLIIYKGGIFFNLNWVALFFWNINLGHFPDQLNKSYCSFFVTRQPLEYVHT